MNDKASKPKQLTKDAHELYRLVAYGNWDEWQRLASEFELKDLFPKGTDLSKVPYWVRKFWH